MPKSVVINFTAPAIPGYGFIFKYIVDYPNGVLAPLGTEFMTVPIYPLWQPAIGTDSTDQAILLYNTWLGRLGVLDYQFTVARVGTAVIITCTNGSELSVFTASAGSSAFADIYLTDNFIPLPDRTPIAEPNQISFVNSPIHLRIQNSGQSDTIKKATVWLWCWSGNQNRTLGYPNEIYRKSKVSIDDDYINFEISDVLRSYIEKPTLSAPQIQPGFGYNSDALPAVSGQGIFWQIVVLVQSGGTSEYFQFPTNFATLGWLWDYEQTGLTLNTITKHGSLGFDTPIVKWFNPYVPKYFTQYFVFNQAINVATSSNMIEIADEAKTKTRCTQDPCVIAYLDKRGLWDLFTPHGKIVVTNPVESVNQKRNFRDPSRVNNTIVHSTIRNVNNVGQKYTINTGAIDESDVQRVEELIYSPKVYLIKFKGDIVLDPLSGITIDTTFVTIDDTVITIDNTPVGIDQVPFFKTFQQIPVTVENKEFVRKTLLNNRMAIDYNLELLATTNKINDIK